MKHWKPATERRVRIPWDRRFMNVRLTTQELQALRAVVEVRRGEVKTDVYPLVLAYLKACAHPDALPVVLDPKKAAKDDFWGSIRAVLIDDAHKPPAGFIEGSKGDRDWQIQLVVKETARRHLRAIERYYRLRLNDLVASAIEWSSSKELGEV